jgi:hypothetical protein
MHLFDGPRSCSTDSTQADNCNDLLCTIIFKMGHSLFVIKWDVELAYIFEISSLRKIRPKG